MKNNTAVRDIYSFLCTIAPLELQMDFDNSGFLIGRGDSSVDRILLSLDLTAEVIEEAIEHKAELIVTHHPVLFHPVKSVTDGDPELAKLLQLIENRIAVISMHTNLDIAQDGVNDVLLGLFGLKAESALDEDGCGRIGELGQSVTMKEFLPKCKELLQTNGLRYYDAGRKVKRIAVMGGSGGESITRAAKLGCDTYLTADIKYHQFLLAKELSINLIDGDHFCTENPIILCLAERLRVQFPDIQVFVSERHHQTACFF